MVVAARTRRRQGAKTVKSNEAERLADEINQMPDWQALKMTEMPYMNRDNIEYGVRVWHLPSGTTVNIPNRSTWELLKAKFATR